MSTKYFNFNNEAQLTPVEYDDVTGEVTLALEGESETFESMNEFAEFYAKARNVLPENLKNWELIEDQDQFAFVLRTGTAGSDVEETARLVAELRAAGMTPEEIGAAVAANRATANHVENTFTNDVFTTPGDDVKTSVVDAVDGLSEKAIRALKFVISDGDEREVDENDIVEYFSNQPMRALYNAIYEANSDEDFGMDSEDVDDDSEAYQYYQLKRYYDYRMDFIEDYDEEFDTLQNETSFEDAIADIVETVVETAASDEIHYIEAKYGVPAQIGFDIETGYPLSLSGDDDRANQNAMDKARFAAKISQRDLFATLVSVDSADNSVEVTVEKGILPSTTDATYHIDGRFYLVDFTHEG